MRFLIQCKFVTDRQTDKHTDRHTNTALAWHVRAIKENDSSKTLS